MRVYLEMTGCRLNQSEIETMARQFRQAGHTLVASANEAELCVVNTCAVTADAERSSRQIIRQINRANSDTRIVVTGCYAQLAPDMIGSLPGVSQIVTNLDKDRLVPLVLKSGEPGTFDREPLDRERIAGIGGRTRAFIKVQDGCNNRCTFCVTTIARGVGRSRPADEVLREIQMLVNAGYQEAILTGVHLGSYGYDFGERRGLMSLVQAILNQTGIARLRLSSLEPWDLSPEFFTLWDNPRLCRHLHLPLQSGCDATLKRMARRTSQGSFSALVGAARAQIPDLGVSTDVIVGFPGETDAEFETSLDFVRQMEFMKLHVFRYSRRAGTAAARMPGQISEEVKKERGARLLALSDQASQRFFEHFVGREMDVLWENIGGASDAGFQNSGLTDNYIRVEMTAPVVLTNTITRVRLAAATDRGLSAEFTAASHEKAGKG